MRNKKYLVLVIISLVTLLGIGVSYAYWRFTYTQTDKNIGISKCLTLSLSDENNEINLTNIYPISDEDGRKLTPYTFKLTNTCSMSADYSLNLEVLEGSTLNSKYLDVLVNNNDIKLLSNYDKTSTVISNSVESRTLDKNILTPGASKDYSISFWMDKDVTINDDAMNKVFKSKVVINATATHTVVDDIVASLDTTGKCPTVNSDGTVNVTSAEKENSLLCSAPDAYGTSYYYRGNVTNNYVKFGKWADDAEDIVYGHSNSNDVGYRQYSSMEACQNAKDYNVDCNLVEVAGKDMYWRIVRINGDGSIRLVYDGTQVHDNSEATEDKHVGVTYFNDYTSENINIGYMYGNRDGIMESVDSYYITSKITDKFYVAKDYLYDNENNRFMLQSPILVSVSDLEKYINYYTFLSLSSFSTDRVIKRIEKLDNVENSEEIKIFIKNTIYTTTTKEQTQSNDNDSNMKKWLDTWYRNNFFKTEYDQYLTDNIFCNDRSLSNYNPGTGIGIDSTNYRWNLVRDTLMLVCPQQNDGFTVDDRKNGNGALTYPIGLLTADEVKMAGSSWTDPNNKFYLYTGSFEYLLSPYNNNGMRRIAPEGTLSTHRIDLFFGIKPVINIKPDALKSGDGSMDNPYTVE